jgi:UDP-N-acetylglucosamine enolpyruvyl transferase
MLLGCYADGLSEVIEIGNGIRPDYINELKKMGADINIDGNKVTIKPSKLHGIALKVDRTEDIALLLAARIADGESEIEGVENVFKKYNLAFLRN